VLSSVTVPFFSDCCWIKEPSHTLKYWWLDRSYQFNVRLVSPVQQQSEPSELPPAVTWGKCVCLHCVVWGGVPSGNAGDCDQQ